MENKYYTPTIEEFHIGFEFEIKIFNVWQLEIYQLKSANLKDIEKAINDNIIRIKYLDKKDIESLGFIEKANGWYHSNDNRNIQILQLACDIIHVSNGIYDNSVTLYKGIIKNKSELKKLLIQLNIGFN